MKMINAIRDAFRADNAMAEWWRAPLIVRQALAIAIVSGVNKASFKDGGRSDAPKVQSGTEWVLAGKQLREATTSGADVMNMLNKTLTRLNRISKGLE